MVVEPSTSLVIVKSLSFARLAHEKDHGFFSYGQASFAVFYGILCVLFKKIESDSCSNITLWTGRR